MELFVFGTQIIILSLLDVSLLLRNLVVQEVSSQSVQYLQMRSLLAAGLMAVSEPIELTTASYYGKLRTLIKVELLPSVCHQTLGLSFQVVCSVKSEFGRLDQENLSHT